MSLYGLINLETLNNVTESNEIQLSTNKAYKVNSNIINNGTTIVENFENDSYIYKLILIIIILVILRYV